MVIVMKGFFSGNHSLNIPKFLNMARNCYGSFLIKPIFFFSFFQQLHEQRMIEVNHRNHKSLLFLALAHFDCQTALWHIFELLILLALSSMAAPMVMVEIVSIRMGDLLALFSGTHFRKKVVLEMGIEKVRTLPGLILFVSRENFKRKWGRRTSNQRFWLFSWSVGELLRWP